MLRRPGHLSLPWAKFMSFIALHGVSKTFGGVRSLSDVDLAFRPGEAMALAGENGSGKSTLIKIITGVHAPSAGELEINGRRRSHIRPLDAVRAGIQIIYQDFSLFPNLSVAENVIFSQRLAIGDWLVSPGTMRLKARRAFDRLNVDLDPDQLVEALPVASKQLVAIARALIYDARLLIMDEPTTALTEAEVKALLAIIVRLKQDGVSVVFVSHKLGELFSVCDRIVVLRNGEKVGDGGAAEFTLQSLTRLMTGRDLPEPRHALPTGRLSGPVLEFRNISKGDGLRDVSLSLRGGEVVGIAGLLGSGRTELAKVAFGLAQADKGIVELVGKPVNLRSPMQAMAEGVGYVPEDRLTEGLFFGQSVAANASVGLLERFSGALGLDRRALSRRTAEWLARLKVKGAPNQQISALSGGNQQRVLLARWLAREPRLLILNGPSVGVDVGSKSDIHQIIAEFAEHGLAILLISDDLAELVACCNKVLVLRGGRITATAAGEGLTEAALAKAMAA